MSTIKATTLSNLAGSKTVPVDTVAQGSAKAWVNFNGTGTVAIRRAFNVSSITDVGTGNYVINFANAMTDASYAFDCKANIYNLAYPRGIGPFTDANVTAASLQITGGYQTSFGGYVAEDYSVVSVIIHS